LLTTKNDTKSKIMEKAYKNLGYFFLLLIPLTLLGFYKLYLSQFPGFEGTTTDIHIHAAIALFVDPLFMDNPSNCIQFDILTMK
jgi:hypothetical protein